MGGGQSTTPLLALHGFTGCALDFYFFSQHTSDLLSWWAPDLIGHGKSPAPEDIAAYTTSAHIHYLDQIAEKIGEPFILLGYSMGGRLALQYALERPELISKLILVGTTPGIIDPKERKSRMQNDEALALSILSDGIEIFLKKWQEQPLIKTQSNIPHSLYKDMLLRKHQNTPLGLANSLRAMGTGSMQPLWNKLNYLKCPVTLLTGETDSKFFEIAKQMKNSAPSMAHEVIPSAGHAAIWENPNYFNSFLKLAIKDRF